MDDLCESTADCSLLNLCLAGECVHKDLFPLATEDYFLGLVIFLFTGIANAAGIAGASILIPMAITISHFSTHVAIPLISATSFGGVCVAVAMRIRLRHLVVDKPRIDYDVAMHLCMPMMLGAIGGVMLNVVLPDWTILALLLLVLGYSSYNTFSRAVNLHRLTAIEEPMLGRVNNHVSSELEAVYTQERQLAPAKRVTMIGLMLLIVTVFVFIRGGKSISSVLGFTHCSPGYWTSTLLFILICCYFMWVTSASLITQTLYYNYIEYDFNKGDFHWNTRECVVVIIGGIATGLVSGLFGIAGGIVLIPILLSLKMRPEVANATCSFLTFFTNFTTFLQFAAANAVPYDYALAYCLVAMTGSLLGVFLLEKVVRKMQSAAVYLLGAMMVIAMVLIPLYEVKHVVSQVEKGTFRPGFHSFC